MRQVWGCKCISGELDVCNVGAASVSVMLMSRANEFRNCLLFERVVMQLLYLMFNNSGAAITVEHETNFGIQTSDQSELLFNADNNLVMYTKAAFNAVLEFKI